MNALSSDEKAQFKEFCIKASDPTRAGSESLRRQFSRL